MTKDEATLVSELGNAALLLAGIAQVNREGLGHAIEDVTRLQRQVSSLLQRLNVKPSTAYQRTEKTPGQLAYEAHATWMHEQEGEPMPEENSWQDLVDEGEGVEEYWERIGAAVMNGWR